MREVVIIDAVRSPIGRFRGSLAPVRADHLSAVILSSLMERNGLSPEFVDDVILGCVTQVGEQCGNIARMAVLSAGWPTCIPGMTVDRKCGSSEAAIHVAYASLASGVFDVIVAGGAESMSRVPMGGNRDVHGEPFGFLVNKQFELCGQGEAAERISDKWNLTVDDHDGYALESHRRAAFAADAGCFKKEIVPVDVRALSDTEEPVETEHLDHDETIRRSTSAEKLAELKRVFRQNGRVSAGNASQICDGASALLLMAGEIASRLALKPRARIKAVTTVGSDPELMLTGPIAATRKLVERADLTLDDIDLFEINEAFAAVPLICMKELGIPHDRLNVNGGAIALGHPLGATGARIMTTMINELERRKGRYGVQAVCCAGGMATATLIERVD